MYVKGTTHYYGVIPIHVLQFNRRDAVITIPQARGPSDKKSPSRLQKTIRWWEIFICIHDCRAEGRAGRWGPAIRVCSVQPTPRRDMGTPGAALCPVLCALCSALCAMNTAGSVALQNHSPRTPRQVSRVATHLHRTPPRYRRCANEDAFLPSALESGSLTALVHRATRQAIFCFATASYATFFFSFYLFKGVSCKFKRL